MRQIMKQCLTVISLNILAFHLGAFDNYVYQQNQVEYFYLDELAKHLDPKKSSGKSSNWHNYTAIYSKYFGPLKDHPIKFLEIGIYEGNGVKLWESYFSRADLHFIDITFDYVKYFSKKAHYHLADQANAQQLKEVLKKTGGNFDIIIDDGGHTMEQQLVSFEVLFPELKKGGMYVIEDLHTSYWTTHGGYGSTENPQSGPGTMVDFLKSLVDSVNYVGARTQSASHRDILPEIRQELDYYQSHIESIHFYDSLCIVIKR